MDDKSLPYNLRLRKDHKSSSPTEHSKAHKQDTDFQEKASDEIYVSHLIVDYRCDKCGCSFDIESSLSSHHCKNKNEREAMEIEGHEILGENKSFRKRSRKGIPRRAPFF
ncbi:hypothetical protein IC582_024910 [Cucumis melo]